MKQEMGLMRKYIKKDGKLPFTDFEQGDIVVYEGKGQKNIIVLDDISEAKNGDIFYKTILVKREGEAPYLKHLENVDFRNWFNGDILRDATLEEVQELFEWLLPFVPKNIIVDGEKYWNKVKELQEKQDEKPIVEKAFNSQTGSSCFTNAQMGILLQAVGELVEKPAPGKTTIGEVVEKITGYSATTVNQNMKGKHRESDINTVAEAVERKFPQLAAKIMKL